MSDTFETLVVHVLRDPSDIETEYLPELTPAETAAMGSLRPDFVDRLWTQAEAEGRELIQIEDQVTYHGLPARVVGHEPGEHLSLTACRPPRAEKAYWLDVEGKPFLVGPVFADEFNVPVAEGVS